MKKQLVTAVAVAALALTFTARADDDISLDSFEGFIYFCAPRLPPVEIEPLPDGSLRITAINDGNIWLTGNPLIDGVAENTAVITAAPDGSADVRLRGSTDVSAGGKWRWRQRLFISPDGTTTGYGIGFGSGKLKGKWFFFESGTPRVDLTETPCAVPAGAPIKGKIVGFDDDD